MTPQEHELIVRMFAKQLRYFELLLTVLKSREILLGDDVAAFLALVNSDFERTISALQSVKGDYCRTAEEIGLRVTFP